MSKAKKRQRESIRSGRICGGCDKGISDVARPGDYCSACITHIREGLLDRARRLLIHSVDERALLFEAILHIKSWTAENVRELDRTIRDYEEVQGLMTGLDLTAGVQRKCPYCGETYHPKYKNSPTCGKDECKKARSAQWQKRYLDRKKGKEPEAKQQVEMNVHIDGKAAKQVAKRVEEAMAEQERKEQQVKNIPSAETSHPEDPITPPPVRRAPDPIQAEAIIEIDGRTIRIPLTIQLDIKVEVNASRD